CVGGVLYDRSSTRLITYYRGMAQVMPIFCILFYILSLGNCGAPFTLNFIGEFMSLYGVFERMSILGVLASSSIIFSAAYTIFIVYFFCNFNIYKIDLFILYNIKLNNLYLIQIIITILFCFFIIVKL